MNPLSRRREAAKPKGTPASEIARREALNLSIAMKKAKLQQEAAVEQAVEEVVTEIAEALGMEMVESVDPA